MVEDGGGRRDRRNETGDASGSFLLVLRTVCAAYWSVLTVLLLLPGSLLGIHRVPVGLGKMGVHLVAFTVLGFLVAGSRWPIRRARLVVVLGGYAIAVESLQWLVPLRTVELPDFVESVVGLAAGFAVWKLVQGRPSRRQ